MAERDYLGEMEERISALIDRPDDYAVPILAGELYTDLTSQDPDLLTGWLEAMALPMLSKAIGDRARSRRNTARRQAVKDRFEQAAKAFEGGNREALSMYLEPHVVDSHLTRRRACDMSGRDHRYVAGKYERAGVESLMLGAFHSAVAAQVGDGKTSDVLDADKYEELYRSICEVSE
jgi:hypothetical protein